MHAGRQPVRHAARGTGRRSRAPSSAMPGRHPHASVRPHRLPQPEPPAAAPATGCCGTWQPTSSAICWASSKSGKSSGLTSRLCRDTRSGAHRGSMSGGRVCGCGEHGRCGWPGEEVCEKNTQETSCVWAEQSRPAGKLAPAARRHGRPLGWSAATRPPHSSLHTHLQAPCEAALCLLISRHPLLLQRLPALLRDGRRPEHQLHALLLALVGLQGRRRGR